MNLNIREMLPKRTGLRLYAELSAYVAKRLHCPLCAAISETAAEPFYPDYEDQIKQYRTDEFAAEFDAVIKEFYKGGYLG